MKILKKSFNSLPFLILTFLLISNGSLLLAQSNCDPLSSFANGGFEEVEGCTPSGNGCFSKAFNHGCVTEWGAANGTPDACFSFDNSIDPFQGEMNAALGAIYSSGCRNEAIFINLDLDPNNSYDLRFHHRTATFGVDGLSPINVKVYLTTGLTNVTGNGPDPCNNITLAPGSKLLFNLSNFISDSWTEILIPLEDIPVGLDQLLFVPEATPSTAGTMYWLVDNVKVEECVCDPNQACEEFTNLTACSENGKTGYIDISCGEGSNYSVSIPGNGDANIYQSEGHLIITNASPGEYAITIEDINGCRFNRSYTVIESCCEIDRPCNAPQGLGCNVLFGVTTIRWGSIPNASSYRLYVYPGDCESSNGEEIIPVSGTSYNVANLPYRRGFSWAVRSVCDDGELSDFSEIVCFDSDECDGFSFGLSSDQPKDIEPRVYPNPTFGELTFELNTPDELSIAVEIYSLDGKLVKRFQEEKHPAGLYQKTWSAPSELADGLYHILFKTNFGTYQKKVVISKKISSQN